MGNENKNAFDVAAFEAIGYEVGQAFAAYMRGFTAGLADAYVAPPENVTENSTTDDGEPAERVKTRIEDCRACWCNTCAEILNCENIREGWQPDGERPNPCVGCFDGMRFTPKEKAAFCGGYVEGAENNA